MNKCLCCLKKSKKIIPENEFENHIKVKIITPKINQSVLNQFRTFNLIGDGYSCEVYRCIIKKQKYACKSIYKKKYTREALNEINIMNSFKTHNYLPKIYDYNESIDKYFILMEYLSGRELFYLLDDALKLSQILDITYQILLGIIELQEHNIFHLDLKLENIIISGNNKIKIIDFGLSEISERSNKGGKYVTLEALCGTLGYFSPEMLLSLSATDKTDLWNLGIIFWMLLTTDPPFTVVPQESYSFEIKNLNIFNPGERYNLEEINKEFKDLDSNDKLLYIDFINKTITTLKDRYNIYQLLNHSIFDNIKNNY